MSEQNNDQSQAVLKELAKTTRILTQQNQSRLRWRRFWLISLFVITSFFGYKLFLEDSALIEFNKPFIAEVVLSGVISSESDFSFSADDALELLQLAFAEHHTRAVILRLNSPGGSPVQSSRIYEGIKVLKEEYPDKKFYVVVEDICTSGCYFVASAADEIYVNKSSIVGSIGVIMHGFGFMDAMDKLGIERRVYVSGDSKAMLDPFVAEDHEMVNYVKKEILAKSHQHFIDAVKQGRGTRLKENEDLFTGLIWLGEKSIELGLTDAIGDSDTISKREGIEDRVQYYQAQSLFEQLLGVTTMFFSERLMAKQLY